MPDPIEWPGKEAFLDVLREVFKEGQVAWHRTIVTPPLQEVEITEALNRAGAQKLRIQSSPEVEPGTIIIINDDALEAAMESFVYGFDLSLEPVANAGWVGLLMGRVAAGSCKITNINTA